MLFEDDEKRELQSEYFINLSESIIKIHSHASETYGELEADELITSLLVVILNDLKKNGQLKLEALEEAFKKKQDVVDVSAIGEDQASKPLRPKLYLVSDD